MSGRVRTILEETGRNLRLLGLSDTVLAAIMALIEDQVERGTTPAGPLPQPSLARAARALHRASLLRSEMLGQKIVDDTSWNMLLDLFAAQQEGRPVYISSLCIASGSAPTTALRHIERLERAGLVVRSADQGDRRRTWVEATDEAAAVVEQVIVQSSRALLDLLR